MSPVQPFCDLPPRRSLSFCLAALHSKMAEYADITTSCRCRTRFLSCSCFQLQSPPCWSSGQILSHFSYRALLLYDSTTSSTYSACATDCFNARETWPSSSVLPLLTTRKDHVTSLIAFPFQYLSLFLVAMSESVPPTPMLLFCTPAISPLSSRLLRPQRAPSTIAGRGQGTTNDSSVAV